MTFNEMLTEAELLYESIDSSNAPGFTPEEWGKLFTIAQRKVVLKILDEGINKNTFNQLAIEPIVKSAVYVPDAHSTHFVNSDGTFAQSLSTGIRPAFFWILDEYCKSDSALNISLKRITYDFYRTNLKNPFRVPNVDEGFWILQYDGDQVFITDGSVLSGYQVVGVDHPDNYPIVSGVVYPTGGTHASMLNPSVHPQIVEEAVMLARMSVIDQAGYQLAAAEFEKV